LVKSKLNISLGVNCVNDSNGKDVTESDQTKKELQDTWKTAK